MSAFRCHHFLKYGRNSISNISALFADILWMRNGQRTVFHSSVASQMRAKSVKVDISPEFKGSEIEISSPMPNIVTHDMSLRKDDKRGSDYDKAPYLLMTNPPEQRLDIHLPYSHYMKLEETWSESKSDANVPEDNRYKRRD
ncbi:hypothetical protein V1515DRAFT_577753 [Lipomyces mesembrius]